MRNYSKLVAVAVNGMTERLHDTKNVAKGDFPDTWVEIKACIDEEYNEVQRAFALEDKENLRLELADLIVCCAFGLLKLEGSDV